MASIASLYSDCRRSFSHLCGFLQVPDYKFSCQVSLINLEDEVGRFRVWAGNLGAHRNGRVSLDHRLRKAPLIHKEVIELLKDLKESLQEAIAIVSCERQPYDELLWPSGSTTYPLEDRSTVDLEHEAQVNTTTELREHLLEITHVITCLYRFSVVIRNPVSSDILEKCASIDVSHYESFDIQHTFNKFPGAEEYLIDRLGKANSRRRQLFKYYERHHDKVAQYIDIPQSEQEETPATDTGAGTGAEAGDTTGDLQDYFPNTSKGPGTIAATVNSQTTIATYVEGPLDLIEVCSEANQSQTSYATSESGDVGKLHVPPPPTPDSALSGDPFECPYCFSIIAVNGNTYSEIFSPTKPARLFNSRHSWYNHEVESHRREWFCNACQKPFSTKALFEQHLKQNHPDIIAGTEMPAIADRCERAIESKQVCPLCGGEYPPRQFRSHLGRHMEQLALFTLPGMPEETDGNAEPVGEQASVSVSSDRVAEETDDDRELTGTQAFARRRSLSIESGYTLDQYDIETEDAVVVSDKEKTKENITQHLGHTGSDIIIDTTEKSKGHVDLGTFAIPNQVAHSVTIDRDAIKNLDNELCVMIHTTKKLIEKLSPEERSWARIRQILANNPCLRPMGEPIYKTPVYELNSEGYSAKGREPDDIARGKVEQWFRDLISDRDVLMAISEQGNIDIEWCSKFVCKFKDSITGLSKQPVGKNVETRKILDFGILRYPSQTEPYFKIFRIELDVWANSDRVLFWQKSENGIQAVYNCEKFEAVGEGINKLKDEAIQSSVDAVNALLGF